LCAVMTAIEVAQSRNWYNLSLEIDSVLVVLAFNNLNTTVAWNFKNRWHNCMLLFKQMNVIVSHIYREDNQVADSLVNYDCNLTFISFWHVTPDFIKDSLVKNLRGLPFFRFCSWWSFGLMSPSSCIFLFFFNASWVG
jgi:hypothetical protein